MFPFVVGILLTAISALPWIQVGHDIECRQMTQGRYTIVEYQLDPDEHIDEDQILEWTDADELIIYDWPRIVVLDIDDQASCFSRN